jgi:hypothetical protein
VEVGRQHADERLPHPVALGLCPVLEPVGTHHPAPFGEKILKFIYLIYNKTK